MRLFSNLAFPVVASNIYLVDWLHEGEGIVEEMIQQVEQQWTAPLVATH